ncbi:MAG TPA: helix-turn-helix domain-containing protein [Micromonosporaceae bacterium]|jgi:transcriptional regulator GlxA family with amidase domain
MGRPAMHRIMVLALPDVVAFDLGVPTQVFGAARDEHLNRLYDVKITTPDGKAVRSKAGFMVVPEHGPELVETADTVIVPGIDGRRAADYAELSPEVADVFARIRPRTRIMSICTGAFVLAAAGLLDDRPATTHWAWADDFRRMFPRVKLDPDVLFVDDGDVLTSAGVAAGIDLCLHVVRRDQGSDVANRAARRGVVPPWRDGGQSQFIERPMPSRSADGTSATRAWLLTRIDADTSLAAMAAHARLSVRTFTRRFHDEVGVSPGRWLLTQRIEHARRLLEQTDLSIDQVAGRSGLGTGASLRTHLHAAIGVSPAQYRRTFRGPTAPVAPH